MTRLQKSHVWQRLWDLFTPVKSRYNHRQETQAEFAEMLKRVVREICRGTAMLRNGSLAAVVQRPVVSDSSPYLTLSRNESPIAVVQRQAGRRLIVAITSLRNRPPAAVFQRPAVGVPLSNSTVVWLLFILKTLYL